MEDIREQTRKEYSEIVIEMNGYAKSIADLNTRISQAYAKANGAAPNDLLDQRETIIKKLSEDIGVTTVTQGDNMINVFVGKGQALVVGDTTNTLKMGLSDYPGSNDISLVMEKAGMDVDITSAVKGGRAGGILEFTNQVLDPAHGSLGRMAVTLAATFNVQHRQGHGLSGEETKDFFSIGDSPLHGTNDLELSTALRSVSNDNNLDSSGSKSTGQISVTIPMTDVASVKSAIAQLKPDDYQVDYDGTNYTVTNLSTNAAVVYDKTTFEASAGVVHDGLTLKKSGNMVANDRFIIRAVRGAAQEIGLALLPSELSAIAASDTKSESGNNANILKLAELQTEKLMMAGSDGNATGGLQESYGQMVADIGVQTHYADINRTAQESIQKYAQNARDNASSVNLDEEAANLMKYQQMFQASTRIISVADELFKTVLNSVQ